jgi:hypothetical protein
VEAHTCPGIRCNGNPQSLNLYGYVTDNPVSRQDGDGHLLTIYQLYSNGNDRRGVSTFSGTDGNEFSQFTESLQHTEQPPAQPAATAPTPPANGQAQQQGPFVADTTSPEYIRDSTTLADNATWGPILGASGGECVDATAHFTGVTDHTADWTIGTNPIKVVSADGTINPAVKPGTAIMTPDSSGGYPQSNNVPKNSATYVGPGKLPGSIKVIDQWKAHPAINSPAHPPSVRTIFLDNSRYASNNSNAYYVIFVAR